MFCLVINKSFNYINNVYDVDRIKAVFIIKVVSNILIHLLFIKSSIKIQKSHFV